MYFGVMIFLARLAADDVGQHRARRHPPAFGNRVFLGLDERVELVLEQGFGGEADGVHAAISEK